jgi:hypothetical protein
MNMIPLSTEIQEFEQDLSFENQMNFSLMSPNTFFKGNESFEIKVQDTAQGNQKVKFYIFNRLFFGF